MLVGLPVAAGRQLLPCCRCSAQPPPAACKLHAHPAHPPTVHANWLGIKRVPQQDAARIRLPPLVEQLVALPLGPQWVPVRGTEIHFDLDRNPR